ncbi:MAG: hypothetical protein HY682_06515 [Chloroflexi bacterium]|nr:hypothetical protein [Chloroflexota bacterium]
MIPLSVPAHHGEPADPTLLEWIGDRLRDLISLGPLAAAVLFGVVILAIPAVLLAWYLLQRRGSTG